MRPNSVVRVIAAAALVAGALSVTACGQKREAEAETGNATAEVSTKASENVISNTDLNAAAVNAVTSADPNGAPFVTEGAGNTTATAPTNTQ